MPHAQVSDREKVWIERIKLIISLTAIGSFIFATMQWRDSSVQAERARRSAISDNYRKIATDWYSHVKFVADNPEIRPYFYDDVELDIESLNINKVLAYADVRLEVMETTLSAISIEGRIGGVKSWSRTFSYAFSKSPVLCQRYKDQADSYHFLAKIAQVGCSL